jgi:hypothetical protein
VETEPQLNKRRSDRILVRMPVEVRGVSPDGIERNEEAVTVAIGQFGAMLLTSFRPRIDSILYVTNSRSQETEKFRVAWLADQPQEGRWPVGVAGFHALDQFWGANFPTKES